MKKSQFKEYLKTEVLKMTEATKEDIEAQKELNKELETTSKLSTQLFEADPDDIKAQQDLSKELDTTKTKVDDLTKASQDSPLAEKEVKNSNKMKKSQFKEYLRNEILREMNEEEEEEGEDVEVDAEVDAEEEVIDEPEFEGGESTEDNISSISDDLVELAKKAKEAGELELANQILNSAKFANKTKLKDVESEI
tara:strand:- start:1832 stop:2416 length:585 start_codon:yes stop_codon:yes gene_type:complete